MSKLFYPSKIKVDEVYNPFTKKQEQILISTGPYRKELAGDTEESVKKYLAYLVDRYQEDKKKYMEMRKSQMEAKIKREEDAQIMADRGFGKEVTNSIIKE